MSTNAISGVNVNSSPLTNAAASSSNSPGSQRDLFMTLLVAQLKNQDPLSPQDGTAFVAQLAQFNSLDQLVGIRQSIEQLTALLHQQHTSTT
ncbi:MAG: flagellar hook assembly protein FlgD [Pyrinomonadaceae bacterium]